MGPNVKSVEQRSQATPLAEDVLKMLQGELSSGLGTGVGPLQKQSGSAIQKFVETRGQPGMTPETQAVINALVQTSNTATNRGAADIRESMGAAGNRYSSATGNTEALFRAEAGAARDQAVANTALQATQFDVQSLLNAIGMMNNMGAQNLAPFMQAMGQGVIPDETIVTPGIGSQILSGAMTGLGAYLAGGGTFPGLPGGAPKSVVLEDI